MERQPTHALAHLERGTYSWSWVVDQCPFCGDRHDHTAGPLDGDPSIYLGHEVMAPCTGIDAKNFLPDQTAAAAVPRYILEAEPTS